MGLFAWFDRLALSWLDRRMERDVEEMKKQPGFEEVELRRASFGEDGWSVDMVHESVTMLASHAAEMLDRQNAKNYVQMVMYPKKGIQPVEVTVRWYWGGLTPAQKNSQLQEETQALRALLASAPVGVISSGERIVDWLMRRDLLLNKKDK